MPPSRCRLPGGTGLPNNLPSRTTIRPYVEKTGHLQFIGFPQRIQFELQLQHSNTQYNELPTSDDIIATIAEILGTKLPDNFGEDSFSLIPLLQGSEKPIREYSVSASSQGIPAVRSGIWKYIPAPGSGGWGKGGDQSQPVQLYNLANDLGETTNLAAAMPDKVIEMKNLLDKLIAAGRSNPGVSQKNDVEVRRYPVALKEKE